MSAGERIKAVRKARGWSQRELARRIGVSAMAVSKWENGTVEPDTSRLCAIAEVTGVKAAWFWDPRPNPVELKSCHWCKHYEV